MQRVRAILALAAMALITAPGAAIAQVPVAGADTTANPYAAADEIFADYVLDAHIPGMVWGIVQDGKLVHVKGAGVQDIDTKRPVTRRHAVPHRVDDQGVHGALDPEAPRRRQAALDAPAETYVPELRGWKYPTDDSPKIRVRELLTHTAGFVTDDPWGDRQTPLPEADFTRLLRDACRSRARRPPRWSTRTSATPCSAASSPTCPAALQGLRPGAAQPLGMTSTGYDVAQRPRNAAPSAIAGKTTPGSSSRRWRMAHLARWAAFRRARPTTPNGLRICSPRGRRATAPTPDRCGDRACASWRRAPTFPSLRGAAGLERAGRLPRGRDLRDGLLCGHRLRPRPHAEPRRRLSGYGSHVLLLPDRASASSRSPTAPTRGPAPVWDAAVALRRRVSGRSVATSLGSLPAPSHARGMYASGRWRPAATSSA